MKIQRSYEHIRGRLREAEGVSYKNMAFWFYTIQLFHPGKEKEYFRWQHNTSLERNGWNV